MEKVTKEIIIEKVKKNVLDLYSDMGFYDIDMNCTGLRLQGRLETMKTWVDTEILKNLRWDGDSLEMKIIERDLPAIYLIFI